MFGVNKIKYTTVRKYTFELIKLTKNNKIIARGAMRVRFISLIYDIK